MYVNVCRERARKGGAETFFCFLFPSLYLQAGHCYLKISFFTVYLLVPIFSLPVCLNIWLRV